MVLQREVNVPVWGSASPGEIVTVSIENMVVSSKADNHGNWKVFLPPFPAGGPYEIQVKGTDEIKISDVMFGDVWVASGQSNMEFALKNAKNAQAEIKGADLPEIRLFYVPKRAAQTPKKDLDGGQWQLCSPATAASFSAVAYFFGKELNKDLHVPVGLINCNWGGTPAEAWTSKEMLESLPDFRDMLQKQAQGSNWEADLQANDERARMKNDLINKSFQGLEAGVQKVNYNSTDWPVVIAPNWSEQLNGIVWLRKVVEVPKEFKGQALKIDLGRLDNHATVYFNGQKLGDINSPYFAEFTVPVKLAKAGKNVICVRLVHRWSTPNFLGPEDRMKLYAPNGSVLENLAGPWKYKTGLEPAFPEVIAYSHYPASLFNGMLSPILSYGVKGFIWYQGESNASRAYQYRALFQSMIEDWRIRWGMGYLPFLYVQLANYMDVPEQPEEDSWAELREAQTMALRLPKTGMAVTIDIGERFTIHPTNKQEVGHRLALAAKKIAYGQDLVWSGPMYKSFVINHDEIEIAFDFVGQGLMQQGEKLLGFQIAGKDKKFYWAEAQIVGGKVFVKSEKVKSPVAVRYAWSINTEGNLYNKNDLPASPFRTDQWPGMTQPK